MADYHPLKRPRVGLLEARGNPGGPPSILSFAKNFTTDSSKYRLLEATPDVLAALSRGETLCFKGGEDQEAVLVTGTQTRRLQKVETSNSVLLVPPLPAEGGDGKFAAVGLSTYTLLTELTAPRLERLTALIGACPYGGPSEESNANMRPTFEELVESVS